MKKLPIAISLYAFCYIGFLGLAGFFSDLAPNETFLNRIVTIMATYVFSGIIIGVLTKRFWPYSLLSCWGPILLGVFFTLAGMNDFKAHGAAAITDGPFGWGLLGLIAVPLVSLLFGYFGSLFRQRTANLLGKEIHNKPYIVGAIGNIFSFVAGTLFLASFTSIYTHPEINPWFPGLVLAALGNSLGVLISEPRNIMRTLFGAFIGLVIGIGFSFIPYQFYLGMITIFVGTFLGHNKIWLTSR